MMPSTLRPKSKKIANEEQNQSIKEASSLPSTLRPKKSEVPIEQPKEEKSFLNDVLLKSAKEIPENLAGQIGLGLTQAATSPLDLMKMYLIGEGLTGLEEAQEASEKMGIPF